MSNDDDYQGYLRGLITRALVRGFGRPSPFHSGKAEGRWTSSRASRHETLDVARLRKRRAKNKAGRRSRRLNRLAAQR